MWIWEINTNNKSTKQLPTQAMVRTITPECSYYFTSDRDDIPSRLLINAKPSYTHYFCLLVDAFRPPLFTCREDPDVSRFLVSGRALKYVFSPNTLLKNQTPFQACKRFLSNKTHCVPILAGTESDVAESLARDITKKVRTSSSIIMPHKGAAQRLATALRYLASSIGYTNSKLMVGIDSGLNSGLTKIITQYKSTVEFLLNQGTKRGPYVIRNALISKSRGSIMIFHDSDDVSTTDRFILLTQMLKENPNIDMVGSHELRVDEIDSRLIPVRFPLDVNAALKLRPSHALLHPTSAIRRRAFYRSGCFSDDQTHSLDTEFLLRSAFCLQTRNLDRFLYLRVRHPASLTNRSSTEIGCYKRRIMHNAWQKAYYQVRNKEACLNETALAPRRGIPTYLSPIID